MNFLSHYYFTKEANDPYFTLGSVLPDLIRNHQSTWKVFPEKHPSKFNSNPALQSLLKGWELHLKVDKVFHSSDIFKSETASLRKKLVPVFTRLPIRPFFLAHVGYELTLDSLLLQNNLLKTEGFYNHLAVCSPDDITDFLGLAGIENPKTFLKFLNSFIDSKYLNSYSKAKSIVFAIDQIGRKVWTTPFNEQEKSQATTVFKELKEDLNPRFLTIFKEVGLSLNHA